MKNPRIPGVYCSTLKEQLSYLWNRSKTHLPRSSLLSKWMGLSRESWCSMRYKVLMRTDSSWLTPCLVFCQSMLKVGSLISEGTPREISSNQVKREQGGEGWNLNHCTILTTSTLRSPCLSAWLPSKNRQSAKTSLTCCRLARAGMKPHLRSTRILIMLSMATSNSRMWKRKGWQ